MSNRQNGLDQFGAAKGGPAGRRAGCLEYYHVVLHINIAKNQRWSDREVGERWHKLFKGTPLAQKFLRDEPLEETERQALNAMISQWRVNLTSISWFMRLLNERIARQANSEDQCDRLNIAPNEWLVLATRFESKLKGLVGCVDKVKQAAKKLGYQRTPGLSACKTVFT